MTRAVRLSSSIKWRLAAALDAAGVLAALRRRRARQGEVAVLSFHRVGGSAARREPLAIPPEAFRRLVTEIARRYRIAPWNVCARAAAEGTPEPHVALTFDDGYADNAHAAWPILRECGATAVFCLTTGFINGIEPLWWDVVAAGLAARSDGVFIDRAGEARHSPAVEAEIERLKALPNAERRARVAALAAKTSPARLPAAMDWDDVTRLAAEGAEFAGHGVSHAVLTQCTDEELAAEVEGCRDALSRRLGREVPLFSYPNGVCDARVVAAVRRAGFRYAFGAGWTRYRAARNPLVVPRIPVEAQLYTRGDGGFSWPLFEAEILGAFDALLLRRARGLR